MSAAIDDRTFRLPPHVRPSAYDATLSVDLEARRFEGSERIELQLSAPVEEIVLHAAELDVKRASVHGGARTLEAATISPATASETVTLRFPEPVGPGAAALELEWSGKIAPGLRGLYDAGGGIAATQFEAADARRVFPCLDEPGFKAPWRLTVDAPTATVVLSNGSPVAEENRGARRRVEFSETPPLPTYLVALVIGRVQAHPAIGVRGVPVRTWAVPEKLALTGFGQDVAVEVLPRLEDYFGVPYAFGKLDQVGLPEFEAGAMENAGLVTYREVALLLDPATASLAQKKRVAEVVTHELAHQWFGNWVTMRWWDDLWLNEAFATWMAFKIVDAWNPAWRVWVEFDQGKAAAMHLDALRSTHPIRAEIHSVAEAGEAFDLITYEKGGAVLRMIEGYLGEERFRDGIRLYMKRHGTGNAVADDLWGALAETSREPVVELANAWIRQGGFPLVRVRRSGRVLKLEQRRFFSAPDAAAAEDATLWPVPLVLRVGDGGASTEQRVLLRGRTAEVELSGEGDPALVVVNAGATGFYRVAYDADALAAVAAHLSSLAPAERIQLLSDQWALVRAGEADISAFLDLVTRYGGEQDYAVLDELVGRLGAIEHRLLADGDRLRFAALIVTLFGPLLAETGWDPALGEPDAVRLRRAAAVRALGVVARSAGVVQDAAARLDRWIAGDRAAVEPNLHDAVVAMSARAGDAARFEAFRGLFEKETDPAFRRRWLLALAVFEDPTFAQRGIELLFTDFVPLQDVASYVAALLGNRTAREPFWARLRRDWDALHARVKGAPMLLRRVVEAFGALVERRHLEEAEAFLAAHPIVEAAQATAQTLERLRQDVELRERTRETIGRWLESR
jgi:puromycin-sensitive aminopeptidase